MLPIAKAEVRKMPSDKKMDVSINPSIFGSVTPYINYENLDSAPLWKYSDQLWKGAVCLKHTPRGINDRLATPEDGQSFKTKQDAKNYLLQILIIVVLFCENFEKKTDEQKKSRPENPVFVLYDNTYPLDRTILTEISRMERETGTPRPDKNKLMIEIQQKLHAILPDDTPPCSASVTEAMKKQDNATKHFYSLLHTAAYYGIIKFDSAEYEYTQKLKKSDC